jgi:carbonyl reductase 1
MSNQIIVVTGGNKGIGYGIIEKLATIFDGAIIFLTARNELLWKAALEKIEKSLNNKKSKIIFHQLDIEDDLSCKIFASYLSNNYGKVDILINNAGIALPNSSPEEQAKVSIGINYYGTKRITSFLLPLFRSGSKVINICSQKGVMKNVYDQRHIEKLKNASSEKEIDEFVEEYILASKNGTRKEQGFPESGYSVSKAAEIALTIFHHRQFYNQGIKFYACCVGYVNTDMTKNEKFLSIDEGIDTPVFLATNSDIPSGTFLYLRKNIDWC